MMISKVELLQIQLLHIVLDITFTSNIELLFISLVNKSALNTMLYLTNLLIHKLMSCSDYTGLVPKNLGKITHNLSMLCFKNLETFQQTCNIIKTFI